MNLAGKVFKYLIFTVVGLLVTLFAIVYFITYHPKSVEPAAYVCPIDTPKLASGHEIKVLSYNVQYFAGKDYIFYYDLDNDAGPDLRPSAESIKTTVASIATLIRNENPDILLLQEIHDGAKATDYHNQAELLIEQLNGQYPCYSEAFYWKADFVPHPAIMGSVGMKLLTLSKYKIDAAQRHQLSLMSTDPLTQAFNLKRAVLATEFPLENGSKFVAMNTHLDAFSQGMDTMKKQVHEVEQLILNSQYPWIIGGDFNLLPPEQFSSLAKDQQSLYNMKSEIELLTNRYTSVPSMENVSGKNKANWYTHYPNDPGVTGPDRTIDYIFYDKKITLTESQVLQGEALKFSDHLPVVATFKLP